MYIYILYKNILHLNQVKPTYVGSENLEKKKHVKETIQIIKFIGVTQKELMCHAFV